MDLGSIPYDKVNEKCIRYPLKKSDTSKSFALTEQYYNIRSVSRPNDCNDLIGLFYYDYPEFSTNIIDGDIVYQYIMMEI